MKSSILLLALTAAAFTSCTTAYKTGQTPDDVYFSPTRPQDEYVIVDKDDDRSYQGSEQYYDDRYLRMRVANRLRWSELDDWYYFGNRYNYFYYPQTGLYYNPWTPNTYWNTFYNPYYGGGFYGGGGVIIKPGSTVYTRPRTTNLNTYNSTMLTNSNYTNPKLSPNNSTNNIFNRANAAATRNGNTNYNPARSSNGNGLRNIFGNGNNNSSSGNNTNSSSSSRPAATSSPSSSGSSSSSAPVRKF